MKKYLMAGVLALFYAFTAIPLAAMANETVKIQLPDGVYMYDSEVVKKNDGWTVVGFEKYFVVHNNRILGSIAAYEKYGLPKLNALFGGNKKYKILCGGEVVGTKYNLRFEKEKGVDREDAYFFCDESYNTKDIKQGPAYVANQYLRTGSAAMCLAVPEEYNETPRKVYATLSKEEINSVAKLAKEKLLPLVLKRKEVKKYKIKETDLKDEELYVLDKVHNLNGGMYIGVYSHIYGTEKNSYRFKIVFSASKVNAYIVTTGGEIKICGMLDIDGCGEEELIIEKVYPSEDEVKAELEIYKQEDDGNWLFIKKTSN